ncbi:MAG: glycosyltransferase family 4 protein [Candidatus Woesearchaeota archaeon]|jgi:glycosyltransferase involved in cell wall biosynthesis|nr:glycosyltransferase family 4 protein [Candidatus Woesearchaeota archaeon]
MKILFVLENFYPHIGGVETVFENLAKGLTKEGHKVTVLTSWINGTQGIEKKDNYTIIRHRCPQFLRRYWFSFLAIPRTISLSKDYDLIHTTTYNGALPAKIASLFNKKPSIITVHEVLGKNWKTLSGLSSLSAKLHQLFEKLIIALNFNVYACVSDSTKKSLLKSNIKEQKVKVVYNGIDYDFFNPKKYKNEKNKIRKKLNIKDSFIYTSYGRPGITKGIEYLVKAVPQISKILPNSKLLLILSKSPEDRYNHIINLIKKLKIEKNIILLEPQKRENLPKYIISSDCVVVPSITEGFGYTAAEACALDIPVITSDTTSLPEVVSGQYILIPPKNPEAIAGAVIDMQKGKFSKKPKKYFTIKENIQNYLKIYKKLVDDDRS